MAPITMRPDQPPNVVSRRRRSSSRALAVASFALVSFVTACFALRPDAVAAITVFPAWFWLAPGVVLFIAGRWLDAVRFHLAVAALWIGFLLLFADAPLSLVLVPSRGGHR